MFGECHGHLFMDGVDYKRAKQLHLPAVDQGDIRKKLGEYADAGIRFYRDGGDDLGVCSYAAQIAPEFGIDLRQPAFAIHKNGHYGGIVGKGFNDLREYRGLVQEAAKRNADFIKIMLSGIMDFDKGGAVTGTALSREEITEMIHIAHEEGFAVMAHVNGDLAVRMAIEAGVDSVEHGNFMEEETLKILASAETVWVPTIVTVHNLVESDRFDGEVMKKLDERQGENIKKAFAWHAHVALGSDAGAYRVPHAIGIQDEYHRLRGLIPDKEALDAELLEAENLIRERFKRQ